MIDEKEDIKISKFLSLILRHQPESVGITLDENGWTNVEELIMKSNNLGIKMDLEILKRIVTGSDKKRFAFNETLSKIRANQGHSIEIELGYEPETPPEILYHGTGLKSVDSILNGGLERRNRIHVHLSDSPETAKIVGQRHGKPCVFKIMAGKMHKDGFKFFLSANGVWLTEYVPIEYILQYDSDKKNVS